MKRKPTLTAGQLATNRRRQRAARRAKTAARGTKGVNAWIAGRCDWCDAAFLGNRAGGRWCSGRCDNRAKRQRRVTREFGGTGWRWSDFMRMARTFGYCCAYCGTKPDRLDPDHVVPLARGGDDSLSNLLPACLMCNSDKRDLLLHEWRTDRERRGLEPRHTEWSDDDRRVWHLALAAA